MKILKTILGISVSLCLGIACSVGYVHLFSQPVVADAKYKDKQGKIIKTVTVKEALKEVKFDVKQPKNLPFEPTGSYAQLMDINGFKILEITYVNENTGEYATINVTDANIVPVEEEYELETLKVAKDKEAKFLDNEAVQILHWKDSKLSYSLTLSKGDNGKNSKMLKVAEKSENPYEAEDLKKIAESFE